MPPRLVRRSTPLRLSCVRLRVLARILRPAAIPALHGLCSKSGLRLRLLCRNTELVGGGFRLRRLHGQPRGAYAGREQKQCHERRRCGQHHPVLAGELPQAIAGRRRTGLHRLVGQVALHVRRQAVGRLVAPVAVLLQAPSSRSSPARPRTSRVSFAGSRCRCAEIDGQRLLRVADSRVLGLGGSSSRIIRSISANAACCSRLLLQRRRAGQQFVQAARPASRCRCACRCPGALSSACSGTHVLQRADHAAEAGEQRLARSAAGRSPWPRRSRSPWAPACRRTAATSTLDGLRSRWMMPF